MLHRPHSRTFEVPLPVDLRRSLGPLWRRDGTMLVRPGEVWRSTRTPEGAATMHLVSLSPTRLRVDAWGPGAEWAVAVAPAVAGADDCLDGFVPRHPLVRELHRRNPDVRFVRTAAVFEALVPAIIEQKVVAADARRSYRRLVRALGETAPGPMAGLVLPPSPAAVARFASWQWHRCGVEEKRAGAAQRAAVVGDRLDATASLPAAAARAAMETVAGVGVWTSAEVARFSHADADAVSVGDYHVKNIVSFALTGEPRGTDERMLELLEPYAGHRGRVVRLLELGGPKPPKYGPRMPRQDLSRL